MKQILMLLNSVRIAISAASIFAGWHFILLKFQDFTEITEISTTLTAIFLLIIEAGSVVMISFSAYYFYNSDKKDRKFATQLLFIGSIFLTVSFLVSANGASVLYENFNDRNTEITNSYTAKQQAITAQYDSLIAVTKSSYTKLAKKKIVKYKSAREIQLQREEATSALLSRYMDEKQNELAKLKKQESEERKRNDSKITEISSNYYIIAGIIVVFVFFFNFYTVYLKNTKKGNMVKFQKKSKGKSEISIEEREITRLKEENKEILNKNISDMDKVILLIEKDIKQYKIAKLLDTSTRRVSALKKKFENQKQNLELKFA